jgi:hypothetical protein
LEGFMNLPAIQVSRFAAAVLLFWPGLFEGSLVLAREDLSPKSPFGLVNSFGQPPQVLYLPWVSSTNTHSVFFGVGENSVFDHLEAEYPEPFLLKQSREHLPRRMHFSPLRYELKRAGALLERKEAHTALMTLHFGKEILPDGLWGGTAVWRASHPDRVVLYYKSGAMNASGGIDSKLNPIDATIALTRDPSSGKFYQIAAVVPASERDSVLQDIADTLGIRTLDPDTQKTYIPNPQLKNPESQSLLRQAGPSARRGSSERIPVRFTRSDCIRSLRSLSTSPR